MTQPNPSSTRLPAAQVFRLRRGRLSRVAGRAGGPLLAAPPGPRPALSLVPQPKPSHQLAVPTKETR